MATRPFQFTGMEWSRDVHANLNCYVRVCLVGQAWQAYTYRIAGSRTTPSEGRSPV